MEKVQRIKIDLPTGSFMIDKDEWENFRQNYSQMFNKLMDEIGQDGRIDYIYFGYCPELNGRTIQVFTNRCTLFYPNVAFNNDHSNDNEVVYSIIGKWKDLLSEAQLGEEKEQYSGVFEGKKISFNRVWGDYRFTDDECKALLDGQTIFIDKLDKNGNRIKGKLEQQEYNNFKFYGFKADFSDNKNTNKYRQNGIPREFGEYEFSEDELSQLAQGKKIYVKGLYSQKKNKYYNAFIYFDKRENKFKLEFPQRKNQGDE